MRTLLFFLFSLFCQAGEIVSTKTPSYLGGGTTSIVTANNQKLSAKTVSIPQYLGGGTKTTISNGQKSVTIKTQNGPKYLGGGSKSSIVKK